MIDLKAIYFLIFNKRKETENAENRFILGGKYVRNEIKNNNIKMNGKYSIIGTAALFRLGVEKMGYYKYNGGDFPDIRDLRKLEHYIFLISYTFASIMILLTYLLKLPLLHYL